MVFSQTFLHLLIEVLSKFKDAQEMFKFNAQLKFFQQELEPVDILDVWYILLHTYVDKESRLHTFHSKMIVWLTLVRTFRLENDGKKWKFLAVIIHLETI